jgi:hypothetical protein
MNRKTSVPGDDKGAQTRAVDAQKWSDDAAGRSKRAQKDSADAQKRVEKRRKRKGRE